MKFAATAVTKLTAIGRKDWPAITCGVLTSGIQRCDALANSIEDQMQRGKTTLIEAMINQELGEPFRRDAMKKPVEVAGISASDMREQVLS